MRCERLSLTDVIPNGREVAVRNLLLARPAGDGQG